MRQALVEAIFYGVALYFLRDLSSAHWYLPAGLRFATLLIVPVRRWPWIYLAECASLLVIRAPLVEQRGLAWALVSTFTAFPPVAGVIYLLRRKYGAPTITSGRDVLAILFGAGTIALLSTSVNTATTYILMHGRPTNPLPYVIGIWVLGQYLGILMFGSVAMLWSNRAPRYPMPSSLHREATAAALLLVCCVAGFRWAPADVQAVLANPVKLVAGIAAFALTYRHGWRGGAVGVVTLTLGVGLTAGPDYDQATLLSQQVVAFVGSALIAAGAVMTRNFEVAMTEAFARRLAEEAGRRAWQDSEDQNRENVTRAEAAYARIMRRGDSIVGSLRQAKRPEDVMRLTTDLLATTRSATASLMQEIYPDIVFSADGLYGALRGRKLPPGIEYKAALAGNSAALSRATALNVYRTAGAAVDFLVGLEATKIRLTARLFRTRGKILVYVRVRGDATSIRTGSATASMARLRRRIAALGGSMRNDAVSVTILLPDEQATTSDIVSRPAGWQDVALPPTDFA